MWAVKPNQSCSSAEIPFILKIWTNEQKDKINTDFVFAVLRCFVWCFYLHFAYLFSMTVFLTNELKIFMRTFSALHTPQKIFFVSFLLPLIICSVKPNHTTYQINKKNQFSSDSIELSHHLKASLFQTWQKRTEQRLPQPEGGLRAFI